MYLRVSPYQEVLDGIATSLAINEGLIKLTGPTGTGKTALCDQLVKQLVPHGMRVMHFLNPPATVEALQTGILQQLALPATPNFTRALTEHLLSQPDSQRKLILLIDDAHELGLDVFNALRMLCNIQDERHSLISLIVCGHESLNERFAQPEYRALAQHLGASFTLLPLSLDQLRNFYWQYWRHHDQEVTLPSTQQMKVLLKNSRGLPGAVMQQLGQQEPVSIFHGRSAATMENAGKTPTRTGPFSARWLMVEVVAVIALIAGAYVMHEPAAPATASGVAIMPAAAITAADAVEPPALPVQSHAAENTETIAAMENNGAPGAVVAAITQADVEAMLETWTAAWQQQNLEGYFAAYADDFIPANQARDAWQAQRQRSIGNASNISISWHDLMVEPQGDDSVLVNVWLDYASATYSDSTLKQLLLRRDNGTLRITAESNLRVERR